MHVVFGDLNGKIGQTQRTDIAVGGLRTAIQAEQQVAGVVVALLQRIFQQGAQRKGDIALGIAVAHRAIGVGLEILGGNQHLMVHSLGKRRKGIGHSQRLMELHHTHQRIAVVVIDGQRVCTVEDHGHTHFGLFVGQIVLNGLLQILRTQAKTS